MSAPDETTPEILDVEQDDRFPSGEWTGFFLQPGISGKSWMELILTFRHGIVAGEGRDWVGKFLLKGSYDVADGRCYWHKSYIGKHSLIYNGYNEGKGIWGLWELGALGKGGFHIWPEAMGDPSQRRLSEEAEAPISFDFIAEGVEEEAVVSVGR